MPQVEKTEEVINKQELVSETKISKSEVKFDAQLPAYNVSAEKPIVVT